MANRAYLRVWTRDFSETTLIAQFARFLATAPLSASENAFKELVVQPIDATELSLAEWDLKNLGYGAAEVAALAAQHVNADSAYIATAKWDLWSFDVESLKWMHKPEPLVLTCHGPQYDGGIATSEGYFTTDLGFEHFFTGHGGLLAPGAASNPFESSDAASYGPKVNKTLKPGSMRFWRSADPREQGTSFRWMLPRRAGNS